MSMFDEYQFTSIISPIVACIFQRYVSSLVNFDVTTIPPHEQLSFTGNTVRLSAIIDMTKR